MAPNNARVARGLPTITPTNQNDVASYLKGWGVTLRRTLSSPPTPKTPWGFRVTNQRGGNLLQWSKVKGADGYEILRSDSADFNDVTFSRKLPGGEQTSYFDSLGGAAAKKDYKIRATAGTDSQPQSVSGVLSGMVSNTSLDATDIVTAPTTSHDLFTSDETQTRASLAKEL